MAKTVATITITGDSEDPSLADIRMEFDPPVNTAESGEKFMKSVPYTHRVALSIAQDMLGQDTAGKTHITEIG